MRQFTKQHKGKLSKAKTGKTGAKKGKSYPAIWKKYDLPSLNETDWAYIAGLFDGEGSIYFNKVCWLEIHNTHLETLEMIQKKLKAGYVYGKESKISTKNCYRLRFNRFREVYLILIKLLPYLSIKREKVIEVLNIIKNKQKSV